MREQYQEDKNPLNADTRLSPEALKAKIEGIDTLLEFAKGEREVELRRKLGYLTFENETRIAEKGPTAVEPYLQTSIAVTNYWEAVDKINKSKEMNSTQLEASGNEPATA